MHEKKKRPRTLQPRAAVPSSQTSRLHWRLPRTAHTRQLLPERNRLQKILQTLWAKHRQAPAEIEVNFVDEKTIRRLHAEFLGDPAATDIITFDLGLAPDHTRVAALYICVEAAEKSAARYRVALETEMQRLLIHGFLHLLGYEDHTPAQRRQMRRQENQILKRLSFPPASA